MLQAVDALLTAGVAAANILYATFDHPILKLAGIDAVLDAWRQREPKVEGTEYLLLDEARFIRDSGTWIKHQVDFRKDRRIAFTGSAMPLGGRSGIRCRSLAHDQAHNIVVLRIPADKKPVAATAPSAAQPARTVRLAAG